LAFPRRTLLPRTHHENTFAGGHRKYNCEQSSMHTFSIPPAWSCRGYFRASARINRVSYLLVRGVLIKRIVQAPKHDHLKQSHHSGVQRRDIGARCWPRRQHMLLFMGKSVSSLILLSDFGIAWEPHAEVPVMRFGLSYVRIGIYEV